MNINDIYEELNSIYKNDTLVISYGCAEGLFDGLLISFAAVELPVSSCTLGRSREEVTLSGKAKPDCLGVEGTLSAVIRVENGEAKGQAVFSCPGEYRFPEFFPGNPLLTGSPYNDFRLSFPELSASLKDAGSGMHVSCRVTPDFSGDAWGKYAYCFEEHSAVAEGYFFNSWAGFPCVNMDIPIDFTISGIRDSIMNVGRSEWDMLSACLALRMVRERDGNGVALESLLLLRLRIGGNGGMAGEEICLQVPILTDATYIEMAAFFSPALSVGNVLTVVEQLAGIKTPYLLPEGTFLSSFGLKFMGIQVENDLARIADTKQLEMIFSMERPWKTPIPNLTLDQFCVSWTASWWDGGRTKALMTAEATAVASLKLGKYTIGGMLKGYLPQMVFEGTLTLYEEDGVELGSLAGELGAKLPDKWSGQNPIASMSVSADVPGRLLRLSAQAENVFTIDCGLKFCLESIAVDVTISPAGNRFGISGGVSFGSRDTGFLILLSASFDGGWGFSAMLGRGEVSIGTLLEQMFGLGSGDISGNIFDLALTELEIAYSVKTGQFELNAVVRTEWPAFKKLEPEMGGRIRLSRQDSEHGKLEASAAVYAKVGIFTCLVQIDDFYSESPSYLFRVQLGDGYVQGIYEEKKDGHTITLSLGGMTLGDMAFALVRLINPNSRPRLSGPWAILNKINLSAFRLEINIDKESAVFWVDINKSLAGLIELDKIGLKYEHKSRRLEYVMTGSMLGDERGTDQPFAWDAQTGAPPSPSAQKTKVYYIGIGQHINADANGATVKDALEKIHDSLKPGPAYSGQTGFLFAADFAVEDMFRIRAAFVDPKLYGVQIIVSASEKSPVAVFNGLELELLYRRISGSLGMFSCTLIVPKKFSTLRLGSVTVYIGRIYLELYTNGSFFIDLGFPHGEDFSQSFGVDFSIYTGRGGIYFGVLKGGAAKNVPATTKGTFSPVVLIGIGLSVGLGRSFDAGIVKGSVSLTVVAFFEGVFAVFHPTDNQVKEETYYRISAKAGVCGTLFLRVDFKVIAVSASAQIKAICALEMESHRDTMLSVELALKVKASIKILFIKIRFSFSFHKTMAFKLASGSRPAPWDEDMPLRAVTGRLGIARFEAERLGTWELHMDIAPAISICNPLAENKQICAVFLAALDSESFLDLTDLFLQWIMSDNKGDFYESQYINMLNDSLTEHITEEDLEELFAQNLKIYACLAIHDADGEEKNAVSFPMPPKLVLRINDSTVDFGQNLVDEEYCAYLTEYFEKLNASPCREDKNAVRAADMGGEMPICGYAMLDYCRMLISDIMDRLKNLTQEVSEDGMNLNELMKAYGPEAGKLIEANPGLIIQEARMPEHIHVLGEGDKLESLDALGEEPVWERICETPGILRTGLTLSGDFEFPNRTGLTARQAAALFYVRYSQADILYLRKADKVAACGISAEWECTEPYSRSFDLGLDQPYTALAGDTLVRMAKMLAVLADGYQDEEWEAFYRNFLDVNKISAEDGASARPDTYTVPYTTVIKDDASLLSLFCRIYPDFAADPKERGLWEISLFAPLQEICVGMVNVKITEGGETLGSLVDVYGEEEAGAALRQGTLLARENQTVKIPYPSRIPRRKAEAYIRENAEETGAMLSRFFLQGLRVPSPETKEMAPWYKVLGQQIGIEETQDLTLSLGINDPACGWLTADSETKTLSADRIATLLQEIKDLPARSVPAVQPVCERQEWHMSLSNLRVLDNTYTVAALPSAFQKEMGGSDESALELTADGQKTKDFAWGAVVMISVCRVGTDSYLVGGASPDDRRRLLAMSKTDVEKLTIAFEPSKLASAKSQLASAKEDGCVIVKTNLSVQTHMGYKAMAAKQLEYSAPVTDARHFLRLLWQCSVIGGGFYMHCAGIPVDIFAEDGTGNLYVCAQFSNFGAAREVADSIILQGKKKELVFHNAQKEVYAPSSPAGTVRLISDLEQEGEIDDLFQIMSYTAMTGEETVESAPVFPQDRDGKGAYLFTVPLYRLVDRDNPYSAVGKEFSIETGLRDIFGNYAKLADLTVTGVYNDDVVSITEYPRTQISYDISDEGGASVLYVYLEYVPPKPESRGETSQEEKDNDLARAKTAARQLSCDRMYAFVTCSAESAESGESGETQHRLDRDQFACLKDYADRLYEGIAHGASESFQEEFSFTLDEAKLPESVFALQVSFGIVRGGCECEWERIRRAEASIAPAKSMQTMAGFGKTLLASCGTGLYGVPKGTFLKKLDVSPYEMQGGRTPRFYAAKPFADKPVTRKAVVELYDGTEAERTFIGCDLNAWVKRFFEDVETLLGGENICMAGAKCPGEADLLVGAKRRIAESTAGRVIPLCREFPEDKEAGEVFKDYYLASLSNVYNLDMAAVYRADFETAKKCRAEIALKEQGLFLAQKITSRVPADKEKAGTFWMLSCNAGRRNTDQELHFLVQDIEYSIDGKEEGEYESSDWVRLHQPFQSGQSALAADFGIPHPLALCPAAPSIESQKALPGELARWNYKVTFSCLLYEQYTIYLRIRLTDSVSLKSMGAAAGKDMFGVLADYDSQRDRIFEELAEGHYQEVYKKMGDMAGSLADAMERRETFMAGREQEILITIQFEQDLESGQMHASAEEVGNVLSGMGARIGENQILSGKAAGDRAEISLTIEGLPLYKCRIAQPFMHIVQNENLLKGDALHIRDEFLFRTEEVAAEALIACIDYSNPFQVSGSTVELAVHELWQALGLLEEDISMEADMEVSFLYPMKDFAGGFEMNYPVTFVPQAQQEEAVAGNVKEWFDGKGFQYADGELLFCVWLRDAATGRLAAQMQIVAAGSAPA